MNEFRFLAPDGRYGTVSAENFSSVYSAGGIPVEAMPEVDVMSPDGMLSTLRHEKASELIKTQGYKLATQPRPLRFASPDGRTGAVNVGLESAALGQGGTLLLKEVAMDKPITAQVKTAAPEEPESPFHTWLGPAPKNPQSLKGWDEYQKVLERNKEGRMGFWRALVPGVESIPFLGTLSNLAKSRPIVATAERLREGKPVGDQDLMDLNLYLAKQQEVGDASWGGKVGRVIRDSLTFAAEFKLALVPILFTAGSASPAFAAWMAKQTAARAATFGAKKGLTAAVTALAKNPRSIKSLYKVVSNDQFLHNVWRPAAKDFGRKLFGKDLAKFVAIPSGTKLTALQKVAGAVADMSSFALPAAAVRTAGQLATSQAVSGESSTFRADQEMLSRILQGEEPDKATALWQGIGSEFIEAYTEAMGQYLTGWLTAGGKGIGKLTKEAGASLAKAVDRMTGTATLGAAKDAASKATLDLLNNKTKALAGFATHWIDKARVGGVSTSHVMEVFKSMGYDGVIGEMLEERAADFFNGLMGWTSYDRRADEENDDMAIVRAFKNMWPTLEQLSVEAAAFSAPIGVSYLAPVMANPGKFIANARNASELNMEAFAGKSHLQGTSDAEVEEFRASNKPHVGLLDNRIPLMLYRVKQDRLFEEAGEQDGKVMRAFNVLLEKLFSARYHKGQGIVYDQDVGFLATMSAPIMHYARIGAEQYAAKQKAAGKKTDQETLDQVAAQQGLAALTPLGHALWAFKEINGATDAQVATHFTADQVKVLNHFNWIRRDPTTHLSYLYPPSDAAAEEAMSQLSAMGADLDAGGKSFLDSVYKATGYKADAMKTELENAKAALASLKTKISEIGPAEAVKLLNQGILYGADIDLEDEGAPGNVLHGLAIQMPLNPAKEDREGLEQPNPMSQRALMAKLINSKESMTPAEFGAATALIGHAVMYQGRSLSEFVDEDLGLVKDLMAFHARGEMVYDGDVVADKDGERHEILRHGRRGDQRGVFFETPDAANPGFIPLSEIGVGKRWSVIESHKVGTGQIGVFAIDTARSWIGPAVLVAKKVRELRGGDGAALNPQSEAEAVKTLSPYLDGRVVEKMLGEKNAKGEQLYRLHRAALSEKDGIISLVPAQLAGMGGRAIGEDFIESIVKPYQYAHDGKSGWKLDLEGFEKQFGDLFPSLRAAQAELAKQKAEKKEWDKEKENGFRMLSDLLDKGNPRALAEVVSNFAMNYARGYENMEFPQRIAMYPVFQLLEPVRKLLDGGLKDLEIALRSFMGDAMFEALKFRGTPEAKEAGKKAAKSELKMAEAAEVVAQRDQERAERKAAADEKFVDEVAAALAEEEQKRRDAEDAAEKKRLEEEVARLEAEEAERRKKETAQQRKNREAAEAKAAEEAARAEKARIAAEEKAAADAKAKAEAEALARAEEEARKKAEQQTPLEELSRRLSEKYDALVVVEAEGSDLQLAHLRVKPENRGKGVGGAVLDEVKAYAREQGKAVWVDARAEASKGEKSVEESQRKNQARLEKFYESHGYAREGGRFVARPAVEEEDLGVSIASLGEQVRKGKSTGALVAAAPQVRPAERSEVVGDDDSVFGPAPSDFTERSTAALVATEIPRALAAKLTARDRDKAVWTPPERAQLEAAYGSLDGAFAAVPPGATTVHDMVDSVLQNHPSVPRRLYALMKIGGRLIKKDVVSPARLYAAINESLASALGLSTDEAFELLGVLEKDSRFQELARQSPMAAEERSYEDERTAEDQATFGAAFLASVENGEAGKPFSTSNELAMAEKNKEILDTARALLEAALGRGAADLSAVGFEIRRSADAGKQLGHGVLPSMFDTKLSFKRWVEEQGSPEAEAEFFRLFSAARAKDPAEAARLLFYKYLQGLPYRYAIKTFNAVQDTYGRRVLGLGSVEGSVPGYKIAVVEKGGNIRVDEFSAKGDETLDDVRDRLVAEIMSQGKIGAIEPMSKEEILDQMEEAGGGMQFRVANSAGPLITRRQAEEVANRFRQDSFFGEAGREFRARLARVRAIVDSQRKKDKNGKEPLWSVGQKSAEDYAKNGLLFGNRGALNRIGFVLNEATHPAAPDWKKNFAREYADLVAVILRGDADKVVADDFLRLAGQGAGERVRLAALELWEQVLDPLSDALALYDSGQTEQAAAALNDLVDGKNGMESPLKQAFGLAPGSRFGEMAISAEASKQLYGDSGQPIAKLLELLNDRDARLSKLLTPTGNVIGTSFSGHTVHTPLNEALEKTAIAYGYARVRPALLAGGKLSRQDSEGTDFSELSYDQVFEVLKRALRQTYADLRLTAVDKRGVVTRTPKPGTIFTPVMLVGGKTQLAGLAFDVDGFSRIKPSQKRLMDYETFEEFYDAVYGGSTKNPGLARRVERAVLEAATEGDIRSWDPGAYATREGKLKALKNAFKRSEQIGTPTQAPALNAEGYLRTDGDGRIEYVAALKRTPDGKGGFGYTALEGPGNGLMWLLRRWAKEGRLSYGAAVLQGIMKVGYWGPIGGLLRQIKGALTEAPAPDTDGMSRLTHSDDVVTYDEARNEISRETPLTPQRLANLLDSAKFAEQAPNAVILVTGSTLKLGDPVYERVFEVDGQWFGTFRGPAMGTVASMPTKSEASRLRMSMQSIAGQLSMFLGTPGGLSNGGAQYAKIFMDEMVEGASGRVRAALARDAKDYLAGVADRYPAQAAWAAAGVDVSSEYGLPYAQNVYLPTLARAIAVKAVAAGIFKTENAQASAASATSGKQIVPVSSAPVEYDDVGTLGYALAVEGVGEPPALTGSHRTPDGRRIMPRMALSISVPGEKELSRSLRSALGRPDMPATEKERNEEAFQMLRFLSKTREMDAPAQKLMRDFLQYIYQPFRGDSAFIPLDGSTPFGDSLESAYRFIAFLQSRQLAVDLAEVDKEDGSPIIEHGVEKLEDYTAKGVLKHELIVHFRRDPAGRRIPIGIRFSGNAILDERNPHVGHVQSGRPSRISKLLTRSVAYAHQSVVDHDGSDEDGDKRYPFIIRPAALQALQKGVDNLTDEEFDERADPDLFSDSWSDAEKDKWMAETLPLDAEEITDPRVIRVMRGAYQVVAGSIGSVATTVTAYNLLSSRLVIPALPGFRRNGRPDAFIAIRHAAANSMAQRTVDGAKVPELLAMLGLNKQIIPLLVAAIAAYEIPDSKLTGRELRKHVIRHTVRNVTDYLNNDRKGKQFKDLVVNQGYSIDKALRKLYGNRISGDSDGAYLKALSDIADALGGASQGLLVTYKTHPHTYIEVSGARDKMRTILSGSKTLEDGTQIVPPASSSPSDHPYRIFAERVISPVLEAYEAKLAPIEALIARHPASLLFPALIAVLTEKKNYRWVRPTAWEKGEPVAYDWTDEGRAKVYDFIREYGMRQGLANMRAQRLAKADPKASVQNLFLAAARTDIGDPGDWANVADGPSSVFDNVLNRRAELRVIPGFADNVVLEALELSFSKKIDKGYIASVRTAPNFSSTEAKQDWDKLPMDFQIELYDLITRFTGLNRVDSRLLDLVSPAFAQQAQAAFEEAVKAIEDPGYAIEDKLPGSEDTRQNALYSALYTYLMQRPEPGRRWEFNRWNGFQTGLRFPAANPIYKNAHTPAELFAAFPTSTVYGDRALLEGEAQAEAPLEPEVLKYPVSDLLEDGRLPKTEAFLLDHDAYPAGDVLADSELEAARALYKIVRELKVPAGAAVDKALAVAEVKALGEKLAASVKKAPAQPESAPQEPTAALTTARYAVSTSAWNKAGELFYGDDKVVQRRVEAASYTREWKTFSEQFDQILSDDTQTFEARRRILRGRIAGDARLARRYYSELRDKLEYLINHIEDEHAEPVAPAAPVAPVQGTFDFGENAALVAPGADQALTPTARLNQADVSRRPPGAAPSTASLVAAQQAESDKGLEGLTMAAQPTKGYWVSKTTNLSDPALADNQPYSESNRAGRIAYAQAWRNPASPGLVSEVTKRLSDAGFVVRERQSLPGQAATLRPAWAVFEGDRNAVVQAAVDYLVRHVLNEQRDGALAPALSRAVRVDEFPLLGPGKAFEGRPLAELVAAELTRRLHDSRSLFRYGDNAVSRLVSELHYEIEHGRLGDLIQRGEVAVKNGLPSLRYRAEPRRVAPKDRIDSPAPMSFSEALVSIPALAKHKAAFDSASSASQVMYRAMDLHAAGELSYEDAMAAAESAAYAGGFRDAVSPDEIVATASLVTSFPTPDTRAALLKTMGQAGAHYLLFDAMNELKVSSRDAMDHGDFVDAVLAIDGLEVMFWDKDHKLPPNPDGTPSEPGIFNRKKRITLTLEEARSGEDFALLVRNLMQYRHLWENEADPMTGEQLWRNELAVRVAFTPRYEGNEPARNKKGKVIVEEDTVTLGELFDNAMRSGWRKRMLGEAGRTEQQLNPFYWAKTISEKFDQDLHTINTKFAWVFDGQEHIPYRHNYFPLSRASKDKAGPLDQLVGNRFTDLLRGIDPILSRLQQDSELAEALKVSRKGAAKKLTKAQRDLVYGYMNIGAKPGQETKELASHRKDGQFDFESWTARQAAGWLARRMAQRISRDMQKFLADSEGAPNEAILKYELPGHLKKDMATIAHLRRLTRKIHLTEFAPAEFERTSGANDYEAYLHSKELYGEARELWYRPNSYNFMDVRRQYVKETYAAAINKAVLGGYLTITDPRGRPLMMAQPVLGMDLDRSVIRREDWLRAAQIQSKAAGLTGDRAFNPALEGEELVQNLIDVYNAAKTELGDGNHDKNVLSTPKTPSIAEWTTFDPVSDKLLKHMVQVPFTETNEFWRAMMHAVQWTKHMSIGLSAFFYIALVESSISASGVSRNIVVDFIKDPKFRRQMIDGIKEFKRAREHYNPMVAARMRAMGEAGLEVGKTAAADKPISAVERDIERMTTAVREAKGDRAADIFRAVMAGSDNPSAWARLWPGISGKRWSDAMFSWFSAIKEWQTEQIMIQQALKDGVKADSALLVPIEYQRRAAQYVNDTLGGQNFSQFIWATPSAMAALNLTLFAPNWTLSAFFSSGLGLLTQRLILPGLGVPFGGAPAPGQVPMIAASLVSMWVIVMQALPLALQSMAYALGQAAGGDDDHEGDTPFPWQNEPGREDYIDMTPLARLMPWYKGDPTGKRRSYIQFAKQVHETGVLNPMGARGWINEPYGQLMRKLSLPAKIALEQTTGQSPGSDWDLEFKGKGILGALHSGEPGLKGLWTSRAGYVARKFIPISVGQLLENPEVFPGMFIAPTSKGASQSKLVDAMAQTLATYASARDMKTIKQTPRARRRLDSLIPELMLAARRNGYDDQKLLNTARGQVLSGLYKEMWNSLDRDDGPGMNQAAAAIFRVGGTLKGLNSSLSNRERTYGIEITPEQRLQAEEALRRASGE